MSETQEVWTVLKLLNWTQDFFKKKNIDNARLDAEILLAHVLKYERVFLYVNYEQPLTAVELADFKKLIIRRVAGESIAYILGEKHFMHYKLKVNSSVLVPRPETELLVEAVLNTYNEPNLQVLELCTGSGAIAVSLASYRKTWQVTATDISEDALQVAANNVSSLQVDSQVSLVRSDMFVDIPTKMYNIIVANPPYIPETDRAILSKEVLLEPHIALFAPEKGLYFYKIIAANAGRYLASSGGIFLEFGIGQAMAIKEIFAQQGFSDIKILRDYADIERIMVIKK